MPESEVPTNARQSDRASLGLLDWGFWIFVLGFGIWDLGLGISLAHDRISTKVTWNREIGPLLERRCVSCHTDEGFAFPLTTYDAARPWAVAIKEMTLSGDMPPWGAAPGIGHFANDRSLTRHELELIAAWVDGGAPREIPGSQIPNPKSQEPNPKSQEPIPNGQDAPFDVRSPEPGAQGEAPDAQSPMPKAERPWDGAIETVVPLASATVSEATQRTASVTLEVPSGFSLIGWSFEPGEAKLVERVDLELGTRWLGTWTPGDARIDFPSDAGVALGASALFTAQISYRQPEQQVVDYSGIRIRTTREPRPKTVRETTIVRSWRATNAVDVLALRPTGTGDVEAVARFANGRVEPLGVFATPLKAPHPIYRLARPLALPAGARVDVTGPMRLLYTDAATRTVKPNVTRRPRR